jgi:hypothetical protein
VGTAANTAATKWAPMVEATIAGSGKRAGEKYGGAPPPSPPASAPWRGRVGAGRPAGPAGPAAAGPAWPSRMAIAGLARLGPVQRLRTGGQNLIV